MSHPAADLLRIDQFGIERRALARIPHWRDLHRFMVDPEGTLRRLLD
jgi:predicted ATPase